MAGRRVEEQPKRAPMTLRQKFRGALAGSAFLGFGLGAALLSWIVLPLASCDFDRTRRERRCQRIVRITFVFFHDYMRVLGMVDFNPRTAPRALPDTPLVLVTNHPTLVDVTALIATYGELCVVAKRSLFRNPLIGPLLTLCGHINSGGRDLGHVSPVVGQAVERLRRGHRVLMFPEGTRSPEVGLQRFHAGAFSAAVEAGVPLYPFALTAIPGGLRKGDPWYTLPDAPIGLRINPLPPLVTSAYADARALMRAAREAIEGMIATVTALHESRATR